MPCMMRKSSLETNFSYVLAIPCWDGACSRPLGRILRNEQILLNANGSKYLTINHSLLRRYGQAVPERVQLRRRLAECSDLHMVAIRCAHCVRLGLIRARRFH
jgi:hypothetical protein